MRTRAAPPAATDLHLGRGRRRSHSRKQRLVVANRLGRLRGRHPKTPTANRIFRALGRPFAIRQNVDWVGTDVEVPFQAWAEKQCHQNKENISKDDPDA